MTYWVLVLADDEADGEDDEVDGFERPAVILVIEFFGNDWVRSPVRDGEGRLRVEEVCAHVVGEDVADGAAALRVEEGEVARPVHCLHEYRGGATSGIACDTIQSL